MLFSLERAENQLYLAALFCRLVDGLLYVKLLDEAFPLQLPELLEGHLGLPDIEDDVVPVIFESPLLRHFDR